MPDGQGELFPDYRHHGVFTDSPLTMLQAEKTHRAHAIVEQVLADLRAAPSHTSLFRIFRSKQRLARHGRDRVQPHPRRWDHRLGLPRKSHHGDHPPAADRSPGPPRQVRQATGHSPTHALALARQLGRALQLIVRVTNPSNYLTTQSQKAQPKPQWKNRTDRKASSRPYSEDPIRIALTQPRILRRGSRLDQMAVTGTVGHSTSTT
jgi:hypothetical protein